MKVRYAIAFRFQGSRWNDSSTPWVFYLNAGIRFQGIPRREPDKDFPTIHSWIRVGSTLSSSAEPEYHLTADAIDELLRLIERVVEESIKYFTARHEWLCRKYSTRPISYLGYLDRQLMGA